MEMKNISRISDPRRIELRKILCYISVLFILLISANLMAAQLKPFILASIEQGDYADVVKKTQSKLKAAGFKVIAVHKPYDNASVLVVTNDELLKNAAATEFGGFGAIQRVAVTRVGGDIQVSFTNPVYMSYAYQMTDQLQNVDKTLKKTLGFKEAFGSKDGLSAEDLKTYQYMFGMPYFTDFIILNKFHFTNMLFKYFLVKRFKKISSFIAKNFWFYNYYIWDFCFYKLHLLIFTNFNKY